MKTASVAALVLAAAASADDWPRFRGTDGGGLATGKAPLEWSETSGIAWKAELPGSGSSSPILVGEAIYLTCYAGYNEPGREAGPRADLDHAAGAKVLGNLEEHGVAGRPGRPMRAVGRESFTLGPHGYGSSAPALTLKM